MSSVPIEAAPTGAVSRLRAALKRLRRRVLPSSLYGRAFLIIVSPFVILQLVATWIFFDSHWDTLARRLASSVAGDITLTIETIETEPYASAEAIVSRAERHTGLVMSFARDARLDPARTHDPDSVETVLDRALLERFQRDYRLRAADDPRAVRLEVQLSDGVLTVEAPRKRLFTSTTYAFIAWMAGMSALLVTIALLFMRNQVRPIRRLADAAERLGAGRDTSAFKPEGASEVKRAGEAFLDMRRRILRQIQQRTEMLNGVSHDLRTPLTRMRLQLEMMGDDPDIADLKADVAEMRRMLDGYLAFARGEGGEKARPVDLAALVRDAVRDAVRAGGQVTLGPIEELRVTVREDAFRRAVGNLVANAVKYAPRAEVTLARRGRYAVVTVDDDGPGIPAERREEAFRPFVRLDAARGGAAGGVGLGLTVARDIIRGHGGDIELSVSPMGGLRAEARAPV